MSDSSDEGETFRIRNYDDDESDDERPNKRRKTMREPVLRARGLGFVSATAQDEGEEKEDEDDPDDVRPTMGTGMGMGMGMGMGGFQSAFRIGEYDGEPPPRSPSPEESSDTQTPQVLGRGPSAFGAGGKIQKNSFAARMMAKQGYVEGQGLGRSGQGITAPIQTQMLQNRAGLGHGTPEPKQPKKPKPKVGEISRASTPGVGTPRLKAPPKAKYNVTAIESRGLQIPDAMKSIIVDATGAEAKTVSSLSGFSTPTSDKVPTEAEKASARIKMQLQAYADAWDTTKEQEERFDQEDAQLQVENALRIIEIQRYQDIISKFERVSMDDSGETRAWDQITQRLQEVQEEFADYIEDFELPELTASCLEAPFRRELLDWESLNHPDHLVNSIQSMGSLLDLEKSTSQHRNSHQRKRTTPFETLLLQHWFPHLRTELKGWSVYDPDPATTILTAWTPILPQWLVYKVLDEIILPKLIEAVRRFPKIVESTATAATNGSSKSSRKAPNLHTWLFDWWSLLSSPILDLERFPELRSLIKSKVDSSTWPTWKPLLGGSRRADTSKPPLSTNASKLSSSTPKAATVQEDISFKDIVEEWCAENNLVLRSSGQADGLGRLLYRLQDAERRSKGVLVYFQDDVVFDEDGEPYGLGDKLIGRAMGGRR